MKVEVPDEVIPAREGAFRWTMRGSDEVFMISLPRPELEDIPEMCRRRIRHQYLNSLN
jgi:hypothetical protein